MDEFKNAMGGILESTLRPGINLDDAINFLYNATDQYYTAVLRFCLIDKKDRTFTAERYCFRGSIDDWISLRTSKNFRDLVKKYVKLLGTDELFETF